MSLVQINKGTWSSDCTDENDLISNQIKYPHIRQMLEYKDQRMVTALLTSGSVTPYGINVKQDKMPTLDENKMVADNAFRFPVMGRIQKESVINNQVGVTAADGSFQLSMADNYLVPGMNVTFHGGRYLAHVAGYPTGSAGNYIYTFNQVGTEAFNWTTHVAGQSGVKTCFGGYTSYGEASLRGYGNVHYPDMFINHTTIQRKSIGITGSAMADVLWYEVMSENGPIKGWMLEQVAQVRAQFIIEREFGRLFGVSSMKNSDGTLRNTSRVIDQQGKQVIMGDGFEQQILGGNELSGSGVGGEATEDDFTDMMKAIRTKSNMVSGLTYVAITGEDGFSNAQRKMAALNVNQNIQIFKNVADANKPGGATPEAGVTFASFNIDGDTVWFIKHPMFDDDKRFTERGSDGKLLMSSIYYFMCLNDDSYGKNIDVFARGGKNGVNRKEVTQEFNGMTGAPGTIVTEEDAKKFAMLTEEILIVYNANKCGIISKNS